MKKLKVINLKHNKYRFFIPTVFEVSKKMKTTSTLFFSMLLCILTINVNAQTIILSEDFETFTLGAFTNANTIGTLVWNNTGIRGIDPGHSPTRSAYFGNPLDTSFNTGFTEGADLTSSRIDLTTFSIVRLSSTIFWKPNKVMVLTSQV